jgi:hypothetical protein
MNTEDKSQAALLPDLPSSSELSFTPSSSLPDFRPTSNLLPVLYDDRAVAGLLETVLKRAGLTDKEAAIRLGMNINTLRSYLYSYRSKPSIQWFVKFVTTLGGSVTVTFPKI